MVAADPQGKVDPEIDAIGVAQFHLRVIADGPEDSHIGNDALARADEGDQLLAGKFALLIKVFEFGEFGEARPERGFPGRRG